MERQTQKRSEHDLVLYKYRSLSGRAKEFTKRILLSNEVYLAPPVTFNDPFEMQFTFPLGGRERSYLDTQLLRQGFGVLSLTEKRDDILMWGHYADGHRGICIGFRPHTSDSIFCWAKPVDYQDDYPKLHTNGKEEMRKALLTKSTAWSYEREWRIIDDSPGVYQIDPNDVIEVLAGLEISRDDLAEVGEWMIQRDPEYVTPCTVPLLIEEPIP